MTQGNGEITVHSYKPRAAPEAGAWPDALSVWAVVHTCRHQGDLQGPSSWGLPPFSCSHRGQNRAIG